MKVIYGDDFEVRNILRKEKRFSISSIEIIPCLKLMFHY